MAWLEYTTVLLDLVRSGSGYISILPGVFGAIDSYIASWTELAASTDPFLWTGREDPNILRAVTHYWFHLTEMRTQLGVVVGEREPPAAALPFNEALISAVLVALTVGADAELEAEAIAYQRSWPVTPADEPKPTPAMA